MLYIKNKTELYLNLLIVPTIHILFFQYVPTLQVLLKEKPNIKSDQKVIVLNICKKLQMFSPDATCRLFCSNRDRGQARC